MTGGKSKINLDDFLVSTDYGSMGRPCLDPKDIAEAEKINTEMRKVEREASYRFARSVELSRGLILRSRV